MFSIEPSPVLGVNGDKLRVVDHDRGAWLQRIGSYAMAPVVSFQLHVDDRVFLVESFTEEKSDGHFASKIMNLGFSSIGTRQSGLESDTFRSDVDRHRIGLIAAEALLAFGGNYNGNLDPARNDQTIDFDGRTYSLLDLVNFSSEQGGARA